ncbi:MAG: ribonuclease P protein component [Alphaproteobacteria bacterium]|nr:ribonuclease P protein component [Alphaproteobacteria bacterium]
MQGAKKDVKSLPRNLRHFTSEIAIFTKRQDFQRMTKHAAFIADSGFIVQYLQKQDSNQPCHIGFTASRKVGNAVIRNRSKRRLRALVRDHLTTLKRDDVNYVFIARKETHNINFAKMEKKFTRALQKIESGTVTSKHGKQV